MSLADDTLELFEEMQQEEGVVVSLTRGATTLEGITVVLARTDGQAVTSRESIITSDSQDILIAASNYSELAEPQDGDQFCFSDENGSSVTAEARPPNEGQKCFYRWRGGSVFRVRCKVIIRS